MAGKVNVWTAERDAWLIKAIREQVHATGQPHFEAVAKAEGMSGDACRVRYSVLIRQGKALPVALLRAKSESNTPAPVAAAPERQQEVEVEESESGIVVKSFGSKIRTLEELIEYSKIDLTRYEVASVKTGKWDGHSKDTEGRVVVTQLHRIAATFKPKAGPTVTELVQSVIDGAFAQRKPLVHRPALKPAGDILQLAVIPEPHIGKYAWHAETGWGDYDIAIAVEMLRDLMTDVLATGQRHKPAKRVIAVIGDFYHYDTPAGHTTKGTPLDRDGRVQKMIDAGARALFDMIDESAKTAPTEVLITPGNHDEVLSWALQRILLSHYRRDRRVTIDETFTSRKYRRWGKTLLGFTHGDKPPLKQLPGLMASERASEWGATTYREIHTGDKHAIAAIQTIDGVITRTCPSISAADKWHAENGYVGQMRGMETFYYTQAGGLVGMDVARPRAAKKKAV